MADLPDGAVSLRDAAVRLGVPVETLRRRAQRYQKRGTDSPFFKHGDEWYTVLPDEPDTEPDVLRDMSPPAGSSVATPGEQFARVIEQAIAPYAERLETIAIELGRERERREQVERERDTLRMEVARLRSTHRREAAVSSSEAVESPENIPTEKMVVASGKTPPGASGGESAPSTKRRGWFARLFGGE